MRVSCYVSACIPTAVWIERASGYFMVRDRLISSSTVLRVCVGGGRAGNDVFSVAMRVGFGGEETDMLWSLLRMNKMGLISKAQ